MKKYPLRPLCAMLLAAVLLGISLCGCGKKTADWATPHDAGDLSFTPTVYYANYGKICLLYDASADEVTTIEDEDTVCIANQGGGAYSLAVSYASGTKTEDEAKADAMSLLSDNQTLVSLSEPQRYSARDASNCYRIRAVDKDGNACVLQYGNTETGHFQIVYVIAQEATDAQASHLLELLQTGPFGQYSDNDIVFVGE